MTDPNRLDIEIHDSPEEAVHWNRDHPDVRVVDISKAHIVCKGTQQGLATVDFLIVDNEGNQFVGMLTGALIKQLAAAINGAEQR